MRKISLIVLLLLVAVVFGQQDTISRVEQDSIQLLELGKRHEFIDIEKDSVKTFKTSIEDYKYWTEETPPAIFDTALTIGNFYKQNFTHKDFFGKMPFPNMGQTFNALEYERAPFKLQLLPKGKSYNFIQTEEIKYYDVKTPTTEFTYENGVKEGQYLSTVFTHNPNRLINYSIQYRGLRSEGQYKNELAANNAFIATINFRSKNDRFKMWTHYASQNIKNQENAGIKNIRDFTHESESNTTTPKNREVNLKKAQTVFGSRRFHNGLTYDLPSFRKGDNPIYLQLKNTFTYEKQKYEYDEPTAETYYQEQLKHDVFEDLARSNLKSFEDLTNKTTLAFNWSERLAIEGGIQYQSLKLYSDRELVKGLVSIPDKVSDNLFGFVGKIKFDWNQYITLDANAEMLSGSTFKNRYAANAVLALQPIRGYTLSAGADIQSNSPSLNLIYNQSFYKDFNYYNADFKNEKTQSLFGKLELERLNTSIEANFYNIDNYTYVSSDFKPKQLDSGVNLYKIKLNNLASYKKFHLRSTLQYQKVTNNASYLPLPEFIVRETLYWQSHLFEKKAEVQIGFNANYFTEFESRAFFPVLNEFNLQDRENIQKIGNFPIIDIFINMKVKRMLFYLRGDHINSLLKKNNYFSAPKTPFRDWKIQIGVRWFLFT